MAYSVGGIVSGIDTESMVAGLVEAAATPMYLLEEDIKELEAKQEGFAGLSNRLDDFTTALEALDTVDEFRSLSGTSADDTAVAVTLEGDAVMGDYAVQVNQLASNEMEVSEGFAETEVDGTIATGVLKITYGGVDTEITIEPDYTSLTNVVDAINDQVDGVTAYIMDTGDALVPYRLVIVGDDTGSTNAIEVDTTGMNSGTGALPTFTQTITASDAEVVINGITVTDDDNSIDGAIQGVTFAINEVTTAPIDIKVDRDDEAIVTKVQAFVDAYNAVISYIDTNKVYSPDDDIVGSLVGESLVTSITNRLQSTLTGDYSAFGSVGLLSSLGITTTQTGAMELDADVLRSAMESDFEGVVDFFTVAETSTDLLSASFLQTMRNSLEMINDEDSGLLVGRDKTIQESIDDTQTRIDDFEEYLASYEARLKQNFLNMELTIAKLQANQSALLALMPDTSSSDSSS